MVVWAAKLFAGVLGAILPAFLESRTPRAEVSWRLLVNSALQRIASLDTLPLVFIVWSIRYFARDDGGAKNGTKSRPEDAPY